MRKCTILFGAGAEVDYGIPLGGDYTCKSMLQKNETMYNALKNFYKSRENFCDGYYAEHLFRKGSSAFREMFISAAIKCPNEIKKLKDSSLEKTLEQINDIEAKGNVTDSDRNILDGLRKKIKERIYDGEKSIFEQLLIADELAEDNPLKEVVKKFSYFGVVEQNFSYIINPREDGRIKFWRLINYFWNCFFAIIIPLADKTPEISDKAEYSSNKFEFILNNLVDTLKQIEECFKYKLNDSYYSVLNRELQIDHVLTTNYTPLAKLAFEDKTVYLAGELCLFEDPKKLIVKEIDANMYKSDATIFPFLMTQAPIKPIIGSYQIKCYQKMLDALSESDVLIVLGYSFCKYDNHINAIIREYIEEQNLQVIVCEYSPSGDFCKEEVEGRICDCLRISNPNFNNILAIRNTGDKQELVEKLKDALSELEAN